MSLIQPLIQYSFQYIWQMRVFPIISFCILILAACSGSVSQEKLVGKWDYIQIENLNSQSEDSTTVADLKAARPYIQFSNANKLQIFWAGKLLSTGNYRIDGKMLRYTEMLPDGAKRDFPFLVKELSEEQIVFETMTNEGTRVTARKRP